MVLFTGMSIHKAVATSLLVIVFWPFPELRRTSQPDAGYRSKSRACLYWVVSLGALVSRRLPAAVLQKVFATGIVAVAIFIVTRTFM